MSRARAYLPSTLAGLGEAAGSGVVGTPPVAAHVVTAKLRDALPDGDEESWEYAAMSAAAQDALGLLTGDDQPRRVVIAVDVDTVPPAERDELTRVTLPDVVPVRAIVAVQEIDDLLGL